MFNLFCLEIDQKLKYDNNTSNNVIILQNNKTREIYDFAFKLKIILNLFKLQYQI